MIYHLLADLVVAFHLAYVLYVVVGQLLICLGIALGWKWIRNPWFRISHLIMIVIVGVEAVFGWQCPLTSWENQLVLLGGQTPDQRTFIGRLGQRLVLFEYLSDYVIKLLHIAFAFIVVGTFVFWPPRWRKAPIKEAC